MRIPLKALVILLGGLLAMGLALSLGSGRTAQAMSRTGGSTASTSKPTTVTRTAHPTAETQTAPHVAASLPSGFAFSASTGRAATFVVGSFSNNSGQPGSAYSATVHWGDGSADSAGIIARAGTTYYVFAAHTFSAASQGKP